MAENNVRMIPGYGDGAGGFTTVDEDNPLPILHGSQPSAGNSTNTPLTTGGSDFIGAAETNRHPDLLVTVFSDQDTTAYVDFSVDGGATYNSSIAIGIEANKHTVRRLVKGDRTVRLRVMKPTSSDMTVLQVHVDYGTYSQVTSALSSSVGIDADAAVVRSIDAETEIAMGRYDGFSVVEKFGINPDVDSSASLASPEFIWSGGGFYTGFYTGTPETMEFFSDDASDTGTIYYRYLETSSSTGYETGSIELDGTTPVTTDHDVFRMNRMWYDSGSDTALNAGEITARHSTTTANVFARIREGYGQTTICASTVPAGNIGLIKRIAVHPSKAKGAVITGALWIREPGRSPRFIRDFTATDQQGHLDPLYGGIRLNPLTDFIVAVYSCSVNDVEVFATIDGIYARVLS